MTEETGRLDRGDGIELAWRRIPGREPGVVFLGGFNSDMTGSKAEDLSAFCAARGQAFLRLDYSGHGASGGRFEIVSASSTAAFCSGVLSSAGTNRAPTAVMSMNGTGSAPRSRRSTVPSGCSRRQTFSKVSATERETEVSPARLASRRKS